MVIVNHKIPSPSLSRQGLGSSSLFVAPIRKMKDAIYLVAIYHTDLSIASLDKDDIIYRNTMYSGVEE